MEITCNRCHQTVLAENCYCPSCGLPQLICATDGSAAQAQPEPWDGVVRDAGSIHWKPALSAAFKLAIPAGVLCSEASPLRGAGLIWMTSAAMLAVMFYLRSQRPAWITIGAGARIGLVTGLLAAWLAFCVSSSSLFVERVIFHQSSQIDASYNSLFVDRFQQTVQQSLAGMAPADAAQSQSAFNKIQAIILSPEGHAGMWAASLAIVSCFLLIFAVAGGALGARMLGRSRQPEL
jgi:hypothetical protein